MRIAAISSRDKFFEIEAESLYNTNDIAAAYCFGAREHWDITNAGNSYEGLDALFVTMWKVKQPWEKRWLEIPYEFKEKWPDKKLILHQEAEAEWFLMRPGPEWSSQLEMMELLKDKVDIFLAHNQRDRSLYQSFMKRGRAVTWRTVQDVARVAPYRQKPAEKRKTVGVSTYDGRANGLLGLCIASSVTDDITQITRSAYHDNRNAEANAHFGVKPWVVKELPWLDWIDPLSNIYVYLHPMPAAAAGRDTIACAALGIPVIGNKNLDAQVELFPDLAIDPYDTPLMKKLLTDLLGSEEFHESCCQRGLKAVELYDLSHGLARAEGMKIW